MNITALDVLKLKQAVSMKMLSDGIDQWDDIYPNLEVIQRDIDCGWARWIKSEGNLVAYASINSDESPEYKLINWQYTGSKYLVIHRVMVSPVHQGMGLGKRIMKLLHDEAKQAGYECIRLDAFSQNLRANQLYIGLGYQNRGVVTFRKGIFNCYERIG